MGKMTGFHFSFFRASLVQKSAILAAFILLAGFAFQAEATTTSPDEFSRMIATAKSEMVTNPRLAVQHAESLERLATETAKSGDNNLTIAAARCLQAEGYLRIGRIADATRFIESAIKILPKSAINSNVMGDIFLARGGVFLQKPDIVAALTDYQAAYRIFYKNNENRSQAIALLNIAALYSDAEDFNSSLRYYSQALEIQDLDSTMALSIHNNRANALTQAGKFDEAKVDFGEALKIARKLNSPELQSQILRNLAGSQLNAGRTDDAERTISLGMRLSQSDAASATHMQFVSAAARVALVRGRIGEAAMLIRRVFVGVDLANTSLAFRNSHETAVAVFKRLGEPALALQHLESMKRLDDETTKPAASTNTALMSARFDYANQNLKISRLRQAELERIVEFEKARARVQRTLFGGVVAATLLCVAMLLFALITVRRSRNEVRAANVDLARINAALERALAAKTEFLATTSHEIRTPLNGILGMTQVMLVDQTLSESVRERLGVIKSAGITMRALVDDILDVAKMETGNLTIEAVPMNLHSTMHDVSRLWAEQAKARGISFAVDVADAPATIQGDPARIRQIVFNLLSNAMKFTKQGSVTIRVSAEDGDILQIAVIDTGIGIPEDKQNEIFEAFRQVDAGTTRKYGGTGLGLAICRNLAQAMGGTVTVHSKPGEGATFALTLPLVLTDEVPVADVNRVMPRGLLIVEHNPIAASMFRALLGARAGNICTASGMDDAAMLVRDGEIDAVLIDMTTLQLAATPVEQLRALVQAAGNAPVYLLSDAVLAAQRSVWEACGIARLVEKPIGGAALVEMLYPQACSADTGSGMSIVASRAA